MLSLPMESDLFMVVMPLTECNLSAVKLVSKLDFLTQWGIVAEYDSQTQRRFNTMEITRIESVCSFCLRPDL